MSHVVICSCRYFKITKQKNLPILQYARYFLDFKKNDSIRRVSTKNTLGIKEKDGLYDHPPSNVMICPVR